MNRAASSRIASTCFCCNCGVNEAYLTSTFHKCSLKPWPNDYTFLSTFAIHLYSKIRAMYCVVAKHLDISLYNLIDLQQRSLLSGESHSLAAPFKPIYALKLNFIKESRRKQLHV